MTDEVVGIDCINQNVLEVSHRHRKQIQVAVELVVDIPNTSVFPKFHIPRKQVAKANQAQPKIPGKYGIAKDNEWLPIYNPAPP